MYFQQFSHIYERILFTNFVIFSGTLRKLVENEICKYFIYVH